MFKLEHAENRRTRVRQKLLEHVAAAAIMSTGTNSNAIASCEVLQQVIGAGAPVIGASDLTTPPRSPTKETFLHAESPPSPSPQRVVNRVPSVIPEETDSMLGRTSIVSTAQSALERMESIRIYADSDVYELLADVENEFTKLNGEGVTSPELTQDPVFAEKRRELHRARSHELLSGLSKESATVPISSVPIPEPFSKEPSTAAAPPVAAPPAEEENVFLTAAVFQPEKTKSDS